MTQSPASAPRASSRHRLEPLRHIDAGALDVAYYEAGPAAGPAVLLLHGFPTTSMPRPTEPRRQCGFQATASIA